MTMLCARRHALVALLLAPLLVAAADQAPAFAEKLADKALLQQVRHGGYVLYMRHGTTDNSRPDRTPSVDLDDCATQRPLTDEGRQLAARVGESVRKAKLPIADIHVSPLCRAKESAGAAFGQKFQVNKDLMYTANLTSEQKKPILEATRQLLSRAVAAGSNRVIVAHAPNLMDLIGYFPKEATLVIFQPRGDGRFDYLASIPPGRWAELER